MSKDFNVSNALDAVYPIFGGCGSLFTAIGASYAGAKLAVARNRDGALTYGILLGGYLRIIEIFDEKQKFAEKVGLAKDGLAYLATKISVAATAAFLSIQFVYQICFPAKAFIAATLTPGSALVLTAGTLFAIYIGFKFVDLLDKA